MKKYTVIGLWHGQPIPVGVVEGWHEVSGGENPFSDEGVWATFVEAPDPKTAERRAVAEMRENEEGGTQP